MVDVPAQKTVFGSVSDELPTLLHPYKNALIITATADTDLAIKDLVHSAFGHAGQKCSAASLALIEASLYDSPRFLDQLRDAAASLHVGPADDPAAFVTPLIREPSPHLLRGLTQLDEGESWLLKPRQLGSTLWSPGIRLGVKPGSWIHRTELFGPVLSLIRIESLEEGLEIQNSSDFGLTGGIHSLDTREIALWREQVEVGNAYINRPITGAIVNRQPFGGWKRSCFGPGAKAGGPNYVAQLGTWKQTSDPKVGATSEISNELSAYVSTLSTDLKLQKATLTAAAASFTHWHDKEFAIEHDPSQLKGESNHFRYRSLRRILVRGNAMSGLDLALVQLAGKILNVKIDISLDQAREGINATIETDAALCARLGKISQHYGSLRVPGASEDLRRAANDAPIQLIDWEVISNGRIELLHYLREQSISETTHRYGNIIPKPHECV